jgi:hypothetical protein
LAAGAVVVSLANESAAKARVTRETRRIFFIVITFLWKRDSGFDVPPTPDRHKLLRDDPICARALRYCSAIFPKNCAANGEKPCSMSRAGLLRRSSSSC